MTSRTALPANPFPVPERALPPLTRLDEYEIEQVLAQSSFAVIYRAYDHALKLHVAIKEYLPDALALRSAEVQVVTRSRGAAERFEAGRQAFIVEAQTLARCVHPALLRVLRLVHANGTVYRVMPYAPGVTLLEHRRERAAAPLPGVLCHWLDGLLGALSALHGDGCVHGAVAPGNILRLADEQPLLLDFDAVRATLISDRTQSMMSALEPCFAPPEQAAPSTPTSMGPWTDLYAMAASLHFCVTGHLPAATDDHAPGGRFESLVGHWQRQHPGATVPQDLQRLYGSLDACLVDDPAQRPQSVAEFRELLGHGHRPFTAPAAASATPAATQATVAPPAAGAVPPHVAAPAEPEPTEPRDPRLADAAGARIIADLDQTFAAIAARAHEPAAPGESTAAPLDARRPSAAADEAAWPADVAAPPAPDPADAGAPAFTRPARRAAALQGVAAAVLLGLAIGAGLWWQSAGDRDRSAQAAAAEAPAVVATPAVVNPAAATLRPVAPVEMPPRPAAPPPLVYAAPSAGAGTETTKAAAVAATPSAVTPTAAEPTAATPAAVEPTVAAPKVDEPAAPAQPPPPKKQPTHAKVTLPASPADACGQRTQFALYRCMHTQCAQAKWHDHVQCERLRRADELP